MNKNFTPGELVYAVERDELGDATDVCGCMFIATAGNVAICSAFVNGINTLEETLQEHIEDTRRDYYSGFMAYPLSDCYNTLEEANEQLEKELQDE